jgi:alkylation response protein AidB-like acyl-CoA dehydrogenase
VNDRAFLAACRTDQETVAGVRRWIAAQVPAAWRQAAERGGPSAVRAVRSAEQYRAWYPAFAGSGLVVPRWPASYGGLDWPAGQARAAERVLAPYHLPRLNPLGLNLAAPALFEHGTEEQRLRFLPGIASGEQTWCQLFSEPGAGSDLASLATRAVLDGGHWVITGQKVWTTWAHLADYAVLLARTDPDVPKHKGITYFLIDMHQPGVQVRPLRHIGGEVDFNEVFLDGALVPDTQRVGAAGDGWRVARATLSGERQMVSGSGSGGVDRIGGTGVKRLIQLAMERSAQGLPYGWDDLRTRDQLVRLWCEEQIRAWTNARVAADLKAGLPPGAESSIGKVHGSELNQRIQLAAAQLLGLTATAWDGPAGGALDGYAESMPAEVRGMLRSRANTIEGGTSEVNRNILAERVLGFPRGPDLWHGLPWREVPRGLPASGFSGSQLARGASVDDGEVAEITDAVRRLVRESIMPLEAQIDETDEMPADLRQKAAQMGLYGFAIPEAYGGLGLSMTQEARVVMELGYTTPAFRSLFGTNNGIAGHVLLEGGTQEQKQTYLPRLASGEWTASFALTEAEAGSDPAGLSTTARRTEGGYLLTGAKRYITNAPVADLFMVFARHETAGISVFLVPGDAPGLSVGPRDKKMGQHGAWTADVILDEVMAPDQAVVGGQDGIGAGYRTALRCLAHGRLHIAALCAGLAQRLLDETVCYALARKQSGHPIAEFQLIQGLIADSQTDVYAGHSLVLAACRAFDEGTDTRLGPSCAKYFASEMVGRVADRAVQVHGGAGYMRGVPVERFYRDARLFRIYEGTSQVQQVIIAKQALAQHSFAQHSFAQHSEVAPHARLPEPEV